MNAGVSGEPMSFHGKRAKESPDRIVVFLEGTLKIIRFEQEYN